MFLLVLPAAFALLVLAGRAHRREVEASWRALLRTAAWMSAFVAVQSLLVEVSADPSWTTRPEQVVTAEGRQTIHVWWLPAHGGPIHVHGGLGGMLGPVLVLTKRTSVTASARFPTSASGRS